MGALVTIGIPCYNAERWLREAIESALAQTWSTYEVIVVDDGSTDRSREIVRSFGERVRLIEADHGGGNRARNAALAAARGEWIQYLDADDYLEPKKIEQQFAEIADSSSVDAIYSPYWFERVGPPKERWLSELDPKLDLFAQWLAWQLPQTGAVLWRRETLQRLGGWKPDQPCCQEHELYLRALKMDARFAYAPTAHAVYRLWSEDTVCRKDPGRTIRVRTDLLDDAREWLCMRSRWTPAHRKIAGQACFEMARTIARTDLEKAAAYHRERWREHMMEPNGPAAPLNYRAVYRLFGFETAEKVARWRRRAGSKAPR